MYKILIRFKGKLLSPWGVGDYELEYTPKMWTTPKVGLLFFYNDPIEATDKALSYKEFETDRTTQIEIWNINIKDVTILTFGVPKFVVDWKDFWKKSQYLIQDENDSTVRMGVGSRLYCTSQIRLTTLQKKI